MRIASAHLKDAQIVVIGAGAIGSSVAYRLAQAGASVTVVERRYPGSGTSGNSFAWINSFGKTPLEYHRLNARAARDHMDLAREVGGEWIHMDGGLQWANNNDPQRSERLRATARRLREWGYRIESIEPERVMRDLEPDLFINPELVDEVFVTPDEGWVSAVGLCHEVLSTAVRRYGARLIRDEVVGLSGPNGSVDSVELASGTSLPADVVINAAGPDAARIAALVGVELAIRRQPGLLVVTEPAPITLRSVVHAPEIHVHPDGGWRLLLQGESYDQIVVEDPDIAQDHPIGPRAIEDASPILPNLKGIRPEGIRVGVRPMPIDGQSIVGFEPEVSGLYEIVTHSGITLCATLGLLVTEELSGGSPPELELFRPDRFAEGSRIVPSASFE